MALDEAEVLVAGGGIAALAAALFAARNGRRTSVLAGGITVGGSLLSIGRIEDFPGFPQPVSGYELCPMAQEHALDAGAEFHATAIEKLEPAGDRWLAKTNDGETLTSTVIVATGSRLKRLGVPGEARLAGKGVSQCATCDGPLLAGRTVAVVGGGDSALLEALELTESVGKVILFHRGQALDGQHTYRERVLTHPAIDVCYGSVVEEIVGEVVVSGLRVRDGRGAVQEHEVAAVFIYVGLEPNTEFLANSLRLDNLGRIPTDGSLRTELRGVFAAGDVRSDSARQAVTAAGDGATAAIAANKYLEDRSWPMTRSFAPSN